MGDKRPRDVDEVCAFISGVFGECSEVQLILEAARNNEIDGSVISTMTEPELREQLGLRSFGKVPLHAALLCTHDAAMLCIHA